MDLVSWFIDKCKDFQSNASILLLQHCCMFRSTYGTIIRLSNKPTTLKQNENTEEKQYRKIGNLEHNFELR